MTSHSTSSGDDVSDDVDADDDDLDDIPESAVGGGSDVRAKSSAGCSSRDHSITDNVPNDDHREAGSRSWWGPRGRASGSVATCTATLPAAADALLEANDGGCLRCDSKMTARTRSVSDQRQSEVGGRSSLLYAVPPTPSTEHYHHMTAVQWQIQRRQGGRRYGLSATLPVSATVPVFSASSSWDCDKHDDNNFRRHRTPKPPTIYSGTIEKHEAQGCCNWKDEGWELDVRFLHILCLNSSLVFAIAVYWSDLQAGSKSLKVSK